MEEITPLQPEEPKTITLERSALGHLMETARWGKLMAIAGFVGLGLLVLLGIFLQRIYQRDQRWRARCASGYLFLGDWFGVHSVCSSLLFPGTVPLQIFNTNAIFHSLQNYRTTHRSTFQPEVPV
ncbi:hypothetical protein [Algoriphagus boritolerans]|uniref:hypothetical protein n=1 Tax=Algoriphagus boritolerans TaxID=308111 RepID=UPI000AE49F86